MIDVASARAAPSYLLSLPPRPRAPARHWTRHRRLPTHHHQRLAPFPPVDDHPAATATQQRQQQAPLLAVENCHQTRRLRGLPAGKLSTSGCFCPIRLLEEQDGGNDRSSDEFWAVVNSLKETGRVGDARQMFDVWTNREPSRATSANYSRIARLLCEEGSVEEAGSVLREMSERGLKPSLPVYNSFVHALAREGDFQGATEAIGRMGEMGLGPVPETYHGLIRAYGETRMYDEMSKCVRGMASIGCSPNEVTYNMLIVEYARGGLLERMEGAHRTLLSKRMNLLPSTMVAMLETYADLGVLEKMEKAYRRCLSSKAYLKESLIRKLALVYIESYRFARLEEFGNEIASRTGRTFMVWCLLLLASALLSSRKGMESIAREMKVAKVSPHVTFTNIIALAHVRMKDFRDLDLLLSQIGASDIKPDLVTVGILFDACSCGFDGTRALDVWRRNRFLEQTVEMNTDPLVIAAFGKGSFLRSCEEQFSALGPKAREKKAWTYIDLIRLVFSDSKRKGSAGELTV